VHRTVAKRVAAAVLQHIKPAGHVHCSTHSCTDIPKKARGTDLWDNKVSFGARSE
jgi:hypothetical protein